ncbi:MAG: LemA family protein [Bacteroidales bacterium]|nr:LemA family protein [Bacteroidales bacterium]
MKNISKKLIGIVVVVLILIAAFVKPYNNMVSKDETCSKAWSNVENVYQRRLDLIPNLVKTVQGAADYEKGTLEAVVEARAKATSVQVDANNLTEEAIAKFQAAQDQLSSALSKMLVTVERYPELKANQNFLELQAQLEGTENRIAVERNKFNETVGDYNSYIRKFPNNIISGLFNFDKKGYFKATAGAENAPDVNFNFD